MKSIAGTALRGLSECFAPLRAAPPEREVRPAPGLGLPALELYVAPLGPHAGLEDESQPDSGEDVPAGSGNRADERRNDEESDPDREDSPFDDRMVDEPPPLLPADHAC